MATWQTNGGTNEEVEGESGARDINVGVIMNGWI